jgi:sucrose-6-phosphatase
MSDQKVLMAVDLDGTMHGDPGSLDVLNRALLEARERFTIAYVTGRTRSSALWLIHEGGLLPPDFLAADVGGSISSGPHWLEDAAWRRNVASGWNPLRIRLVASLFPSLQPQPADHQGEFKLSYHLPGSEATATLPRVADALKRQRLPARLVYSSERDLDLLPLRSGKAAAVAHLITRSGVDKTRVFTCGDSGNDLDMLQPCYCSAAVGNAQPELLRSLSPGVFRARGHYAAGVLEGLKHYGFLAG